MKHNQIRSVNLLNASQAALPKAAFFRADELSQATIVKCLPCFGKPEEKLLKREYVTDDTSVLQVGSIVTFPVLRQGETSAVNA